MESLGFRSIRGRDRETKYTEGYIQKCSNSMCALYIRVFNEHVVALFRDCVWKGRTTGVLDQEERERERERDRACLYFNE